MNYEWYVMKADDDNLVEKLNSVKGDWEVFSIVPTLAFDKKIMGTVIPSGVKHNIVLRKAKVPEN